MYKSSRILAAQKFLSTAENDTRFPASAFSTFVQLTNDMCLEFDVEQGVAMRENCGNVGADLLFRRSALVHPLNCFGLLPRAVQIFRIKKPLKTNNVVMKARTA